MAAQGAANPTNGHTANGQPVLLDLYCGAGGAAMGYHQAGFEVIGFDLAPQPRYPFEFHQADVTKLDLADVVGCTGAVAIHASPPCHDHSSLRNRTGLDHGTGWLLEATIELLEAIGKPYVVENVAGADMKHSVVLCGSMFGLSAVDHEGHRRTLRRHRQFRTTSYVLCPPDQCAGQLVGGVYGTGGGGHMTRGYKFLPHTAREAMGIDWMSTAELSQAIPPAYTEFLGAELLAQLEREAAA